MKRAAALLTLALALAGTGCAMSVEGDLPEIEVVQHGLVLPGVPRELGNGDVSIVLPSFFQASEQLGLPPESYRSVKVKDVTLRLTGGGGGAFTFLSRLRVTVNGLQSYLIGVPPAEVAHYERLRGQPVGATIDARKAEPVEVVDAWRESVAVMTLEAAGDLPDDIWTVDVVVHLSATLAY